jgi:hypothetical protein
MGMVMTIIASLLPSQISVYTSCHFESIVVKNLGHVLSIRTLNIYAHVHAHPPDCCQKDAFCHREITPTLTLDRRRHDLQLSLRFKHCIGPYYTCTCMYIMRAASRVQIDRLFQIPAVAPVVVNRVSCK